MTLREKITKKAIDLGQTVMSLNQFRLGALLKCQDEDKLDIFEPENDDRSWTRHFKVIFIGFVVISLILSIILNSVSKIGTQKSQSSEFSNPSSLTFKLSDIDNLVHVKFFANVTTKEIQKNMDCFVNNNIEVCRNLGAQKCELKYR